MELSGILFLMSGQMRCI